MFFNIINFYFLSYISFYVACAFVICLIKYLLTYLLTCGMSDTVLDEQKSGVDKEACELRASLREVEKARLDGRRCLHELKRQFKSVEAERSKLGQELGDLQVRATRHEERAELSRRENYELKQKVTSIRLSLRH